MLRPTHNHRAFDPDEADCLRLLELLADGDPLPDTSAICPERQQLIALLVEISEGERSEFCPHLAEVAQRRGLAANEIASRAGFLLACLDTPGTDDAYAILGVPATATPEEIRAAWLSRLSLYHPDRHQGNRDSDWFTRQAARLNEAYQRLKDPVRRKAYNERRQRLMLTRQYGSSATLSTSLLSSMPLPPSRLRYWLPAIITGGSVVAAGVIAISLFLTRPAHQSIDKAQGTSFDVVQAGNEVGATQSPPQSSLIRDGQHAVGYPKPDREHSQVGEWPVQQVPVMPREGEQIVAHALPLMIPEPKDLDRQEIDTLLDEYVDAYEKADVERLMATLSARILKGTMDYQAIRNLYVKEFAGRDPIIYRLNNIQIEIKGEQATMTAQYVIMARNIAQSSKGTTVAGRIEWKIQREGDTLKIVAINY